VEGSPITGASVGTVSVVIPAYNRRALIVETLESVRDQLYADLEVIIVDDGSTDGTPDEVRRWIAASGDRRFSIVALPANGGKSAAVNTAFRMFHGKFVMVLDSDDVLLHDALSRQLEFLCRRSDVGMVAAKAYVLRGTTRTQEVLGGFEAVSECTDLIGIYGDLLQNGNPIIASTVLLRAEVVREIGEYNARLTYTHDWEYWIRVAMRYRVGFLGVPVLYYRMEQDGSSSRNRIGTYLEICDLLRHADPPLPRVRIIAALRRQTKYNLWLAYHDGDARSFLAIAFAGIRAMLSSLLSTSAP
jgi:glycosyltransferase involved in cell wall biosynthesis